MKEKIRGLKMIHKKFEEKYQELNKTFSFKELRETNFGQWKTKKYQLKERGELNK